jgi:hypothetical protein
MWSLDPMIIAAIVGTIGALLSLLDEFFGHRRARRPSPHKGITNERAKLFANNLDRASTACFTIGIASPIAAYVYKIGNLREAVSELELGLGLTGWLVAAIFLHILARRTLGGLIE